MALTDKPTLLERVFAAKDTSESRALYNEWAATYNPDMTLSEYVAPRLVAEGVVRALKLKDVSPNKPLEGLRIVDAGCGTGLVGIELAKLGAKGTVGLDISEGMLGLARKTDAYGDLKVTDLTKRIDAADGAFDALTCSGTFTQAHLGPEPLVEFVRVVKPGGVAVATVLDTHWVEKGFEATVERLAKEGKVEVVEKESGPYRKGVSGARVLILRIL
ncbi:S-adenosyl-L-methionine-dependent methyltransferase [Cucurbitaria berberidis CBS 394.84]|uniref:S-adenosyl-L-methionine-dependent methyltransferase n=1 Tax=Cucurbitaria berberidis CBS 394.84 TaxID=1168544 RepID=A0A9P4LDC1_9PLEO|nr:S-adenosyl-L-methionine-dependent methyltransferase [Cucurbitaria berberidis CBS 394.84]KAF1850673.1 S-adenosyl-L-methionine-dependent methyltransferase [Cucurbitaria berberidis CBS 394.84]